MLTHAASAFGGQVTLTEEDQRLVGQMIVSSIIRECFARPQHRRRPVNLLMDEGGKFASPEVTTILNEGRKFGPRLVIAHQTLSQLVDHRENDPTLLDAVVNNARLKFVFGGLGPMDASSMGETLYGHLGDPNLRKLELRVPMQLARLQESTSETIGLTRGRAWTLVRGRMEAHGFTDAYGTSSMGGRSSGGSHGNSLTAGLTYPAGLNDPLGGMMIDSAGEFSGGSEGEYEAEGESESHAEHHLRAQSELRGRALGITRTRSVTRGQMVVPTEPFEVTTSVQFESLEEQLHRCVSQMIKQPDRHVSLAIGKLRPIEFRVADVHEPTVNKRQASLLDLRYMGRLPCYSTPAQIDQEIACRHRALLERPVIELLDTQAAMERRRRSRLGANASPGDDDNAAGVPARLRPKPPRRSGAAKVLVAVEG